MKKERPGHPDGTLGIYVHVPYCIRKCRYCDFVSFEKAPEDAYFDKLAGDIKSAGNALDNRSRYYVDSLFFGGGTPSLASPSQLEKVLDALRESFDIRDAEATIEVNPETVTEEKAAGLKRLGFNRMSMGVQSLDDGVLAAMGRVHSADRARQAYRILREAGLENINLDLIFGAPGQDLGIWKDTLREVLDMRPEHISFYSLQLEEGTPLYRDYNAGKADLPSWEENRAMYHYAADALKAAGYHHYEISNAALAGFECRHNLKYWNMQPYLGFGTSAHSFIIGCRGEADYARGAAAPESGVFGLVPETEADLKGDFIFTKLRLIDGFDAAEYKDMFGTDFFADYALPLQELADDGMLELADKAAGGRASDGAIVRFTQKGLDRTNPVMQKLIETVI